MSKTLSPTQQRVYSVLKSRAKFTDEQLQQHPRLRSLPASSIRTRRAELVDRGLVRAVGEIRNTRGRTMTQWAAKK